MKKPDLLQALAHLEKGEWEAAHKIVQEDDSSPLCCWAHGIVHVLEGDLPNARYWYREAGRPFPEPFALEAEIRALKSTAETGRAKK